MFIVLTLVVGVFADTYPYFPIGTCNATCSSCSGNNNTNYCLGCEANLTLSNGICSTPTGQRLSYYEYFTPTGLKNNSDLYKGWILEFKEAGSNPNFSSNIVSCYNPTVYFNFDVFGLFNSSTTISTEIDMGYDLESAYITFRALFFTSPIVFKSTLNADTAIYENVSTGIGSPALTTIQSGVLNCSSIFSNSAELYYKKFQSEKITISGTRIVVEITAEYSDNNIVNTPTFGRWGVREVVLVLRRCANCPSPELISTARLIGIVIGITLAVLVVLYLPIFVLDMLRIRNILQTFKRRKIMERKSKQERKL